jgi:hypothetical protein
MFEAACNSGILKARLGCMFAPPPGLQSIVRTAGTANAAKCGSLQHGCYLKKDRTVVPSCGPQYNPSYLSMP